MNAAFSHILCFIFHMQQANPKYLVLIETRAGWPLVLLKLSYKLGTNERGPSLVVSLGLLCWYKRFLTYLMAALVGLGQNIFSLTVYYFNSFVPIAQQAGQAVLLGRLDVSLVLLRS